MPQLNDGAPRDSTGNETGVGDETLDNEDDIDDASSAGNTTALDTHDFKRNTASPNSTTKSRSATANAALSSHQVPVLPVHVQDPPPLLPSRLPPKYHIFDLFPFSLVVKLLTKRGKELKGKKAARYRARLHEAAGTTGNIPLEVLLYLVRDFVMQLVISC